jgi:hypothetical protein
VLHSLGGWAARKYARNVATAIAGAAVAPDDLVDVNANLTGERHAQLTCCKTQRVHVVLLELAEQHIAAAPVLSSP